MRILIRALLFVFAAVAVVAPARAQSSRSQPRTPFGVSDFGKLRWLAGSWEGTATGEASTFQRFRFLDDSTVEITYYRDPGFSQESGNGRLYLSVGRVYHTFGANRWAATHVDTDGLYLVPQSTARNNFSWDYVSPDAWRSTMRTGVSGHERVIVYDMKRVKR